MLTVYWKRFAESAIGFARRYRYDPFFRTETSVVALQIGFALFLLLVVAGIASMLYRDASAAVSQGISQALVPHATSVSIGDAVTAELTSLRFRTVSLAAGAIIAATIIFSYIITRIALSPTRNALESQKQFIGNIAHELRTPLSVIKTNTEVALMSRDIAEATKQTFISTVEELDRISEIINNLLSLSASIRPERIEFSEVDLGDVIRRAMHKLAGLAEPKKLELTARMSERRSVHGNAVALEQIAMNIIKNAILYTHRAGRVLVTVEPVYPDYMELTVQDSGIGIARKDLFRIFEPYYRTDFSRTRESGGSGLGLTIVSELVKLHNGKITVRSAEGRGTTVTVLLPAGSRAVGSVEERKQDDTSEIAVDYSHNKSASV